MPGKRHSAASKSVPNGVTLSWHGKRSCRHTAPAPGFCAAERHGTGPSTNRLFVGDNASVMRFLLAEKPIVRPHLVYIDPPYAMQALHGVRVAGTDAIAYADTWTPASYCQFMFERLSLIHELLDPAGCVFVHCDWRANAWLRLLLDEVFGRMSFRNEVIWRRAPNLGRQARGSQLGRCVDSILVYSKAPGAPFRGCAPVQTTLLPCTRRGTPRGAKWDEDRGQWFTLAPRGDYSDESIKRLEAEGRVYVSSAGTKSIKYFLRTDESGRVFKDSPIDTVWDDAGVPPLRFAPRSERGVRYVTQKPLALLQRIIGWATRPGDVVADFFAGSGTTLMAAHLMGREWVGCDQGALAIQAIRGRLLTAGAAFDVVSAGDSAPGVARVRIEVEDAVVSLSIDTVEWIDSDLPVKRPRVTRGKYRAVPQDDHAQVDSLFVGPKPLDGQPFTGVAAVRDLAKPSVWRLAFDGSLTGDLEVRLYDVLGRCATASLKAPARETLPTIVPKSRRRVRPCNPEVMS